MAAEVIRPQKGRQEMAVKVEAKVIIFGGAMGSSKSFSGLLRMLKYIRDPHFKATIFRRQKTDLDTDGSIYHDGQSLYSKFGGELNQNLRRIKFPAGATIKFDGMKDLGKEERVFQGAQLSAAVFDEGTHFEQSQILFILGRLRSKAKNKGHLFITCNPDPDSWLLEWVRPYLDEEGYPIREMAGVIRYFITDKSTPEFAATEDELIRNFRDKCFADLADDLESDEFEILTGKQIKARWPDVVFSLDDKVKYKKTINTYTFIDATIKDNPILMKMEPDYLASLKAKSEVEQAKMLYGNWFAREEAAGFWKREWCPDKKAPLNTRWCRAWDKAATQVSEADKYPDYTASIKMGVDSDGFYYIAMDSSVECKDPDTDIYGRFRKRPGDRDKCIAAQAALDGSKCVVVLPQDPGGAGKTEYQQSARQLVTKGFTVKPDPAPSNASKLTKFMPFSSACENGLVYIDKSTFPNEVTYNAFCKELEAGDGTRSTTSRKDDWFDATGSAFNHLCSSASAPTVTAGFTGFSNNSVRSALSR